MNILFLAHEREVEELVINGDSKYIPVAVSCFPFSENFKIWTKVYKYDGSGELKEREVHLYPAENFENVDSFFT